MPGKKILEIIDHIDHHFTENIRLSEIAARFGLSPYQLTRAFKKRTGLPLIHYLIAKRLGLSRELLERMSVTETCFEVGFESLSHFSWIFKRQYGVNPSEYKRVLSLRGPGAPLFADGELNRRCLGRILTSFSERYLQRTIGILADFQAREANTVMEAADRCARGLERGHRLWTIFFESGGCRVEEAGGRGGGGLEFERSWHPIGKSYDPARQRLTIDLPELPSLRRARQGDILTANILVPDIKQLIDRGIDVIGLAPLFFEEGQAATRLGPSKGGHGRDKWPGPAINSCLPAEDGLVDVPEIPMIPFAPGSTVIALAIRSALRARIVQTLKSRRPAAGAGPIQTVMEKLGILSGHFLNLKRIGAQMAERVISGGRLYLGGTLESESEFTWRGSGLMGLQPARGVPPTEKDVLVIDDGPGANSFKGKIAPRFRAKGAYTVVASPGGGGRSSPFLSDDVRDLAQLGVRDVRNPGGGPEEEASGLPVGRILTRTLLWMLFSSYLQELVIRGCVPFVFRGFHLPGGMKYNEAVYPLYLERGY